MKRLLVLVAAACFAAASSPALAQVHGALTEARVVPVNGRLGGAYLQFDPHSATLMGQLRLSFYPNLDFGFLGGLSRIDVSDNTRTSVRLGGDFRGQLVTQSASYPVNITLGAGLGLESADNFTILSVGPTAGVSRTLDYENKWIAYGGASLLLSRIDVGQGNDTDTSFPMRLGIEFHPNPDIRLLSEIQLSVSDEIRDDFAFTVGVLFPF